MTRLQRCLWLGEPPRGGGRLGWLDFDAVLCIAVIVYRHLRRIWMVARLHARLLLLRRGANARSVGDHTGRSVLLSGQGGTDSQLGWWL